MKRRSFIGGLAALPLAGGTAKARRVKADVAVIGAGVFGAWTAHALLRANKSVILVDAAGPANSRASSGGESRVTRCGYGSNELYTDWACRSIDQWAVLSARLRLPIFHPLGVLWLHGDMDAYTRETQKVFRRRGIQAQSLSAPELRRRYPVMQVRVDESGFLEPGAGALMARRAVQSLVAEMQEKGLKYVPAKAGPIMRQGNGAIEALETAHGDPVVAEQYVLACGPWLGRICPDIMADRLFVTRQEVLYFAVEPQKTLDLPVWADLPFYGMASLEGRGFKVADDTHGPAFDPAQHQRLPSPHVVDQARQFLARRFPALADAPLQENRVCQYENSSNGDFVIDFHPRHPNVLLVGCGSGHGFKHGPALGEHVAQLLSGETKVIPRFSLATKKTIQDRQVQ